MAPFIPAQSSFGIAAVLPRRRDSPSPAPSRCASASPAPHRAAVPWRAQPLPPASAGGGSRCLARVGRAEHRGGPGMPRPWERAPLTQARPRVSQAPSRSARRTSSSAGTSGASPPSGNAMRTTTARITATRRIAVSIRAPHGGAGAGQGALPSCAAPLFYE